MPDSQQFLKDLDRKLWSAADKLRANLDAAIYSRAERVNLPLPARRVDAEASQIRQALIEADLVECMVALPGQLFTNAQIPACIWFSGNPHPIAHETS